MLTCTRSEEGAPLKDATKNVHQLSTIEEESLVAMYTQGIPQDTIHNIWLTSSKTKQEVATTVNPHFHTYGLFCIFWSKKRPGNRRQLSNSNSTLIHQHTQIMVYTTPENTCRTSIDKSLGHHDSLTSTHISHHIVAIVKLEHREVRHMTTKQSCPHTSIYPMPSFNPRIIMSPLKECAKVALTHHFPAKGPDILYCV